MKSWFAMEQHTLKNVKNCLNTNIYSYLETSGGKSYNIYLNVEADKQRDGKGREI
jgi:hypothetical protein